MRLKRPFAILCAMAMLETTANGQETVAQPKEYPRALRNPLMGFITDWNPKSDRFDWSTLARQYVKWNEIENAESDSIEKIRAYCNARWVGAEKLNVKIVPRVYLHWSKAEEKYWPSDLQTDDYTSEQFKKRLVRLIERLGIVWDNDARIAFVQMGLIGKWGEHHSPDIVPELQRLMGESFKRAFKNKPVQVRHAWDFDDYDFGIYWDSFAHADQNTHAESILKLGARWKTVPIGGETAYDWGNWRVQPGDNPNDTLSDETHRKYLQDNIRQLHAGYLGWVSEFDRNNIAAASGGEQVQKILGYRWILESARFPSRIEPNAKFSASFTVRNDGSAPLYARWPVMLNLLDTNRKLVWSAPFARADTRQWLPGDFWLSWAQKYAQTPLPITVRSEFELPNNLPRGEYFVALSVNDPAGNRPSARFATSQSFNGGYAVLGRMGIGTKASQAGLDDVAFDDPINDKSLSYDVK